ncbi:hypothetical protein GCM10023307_19530 [Lysobacter hankyongensis]|uniref:Uncharacterized protein n=1 Tax=Lysobacter hankyongensis TaxID=1176535 RepID=A0ABP9BDK8_9GAMM
MKAWVSRLVLTPGAGAAGAGLAAGGVDGDCAGDEALAASRARNRTEREVFIGPP